MFWNTTPQPNAQPGHDAQPGISGQPSDVQPGASGQPSAAQPGIPGSMPAGQSGASGSSSASQAGSSGPASASAPGSGGLTAEEKLARAELVRAKAGVTFEEARAALEANGYDALDAIVWLERAGKAASHTASYSTAGGAAGDQAASAMSQAQSDYEAASKESSFEDTCRRFWEWLKRVLRRSVEIKLVAERHGEQMLAIPLLLLIVLLVLAFWIVLPLVVVSLFFSFRYHFEGMGKVTVDVNEGLHKVSNGVDQLKRDVMDGHTAATRDNGANGQ